MLTPVFSIAYLRGITSVFYDTTHKVGGLRAPRVSLWIYRLPAAFTQLGIEC